MTTSPTKPTPEAEKNPGTLDILIANDPGKVVTIPYKDSEPIFFILQRVSNKLQDNGTQMELFINGIHAEDPRYSIAKYRIYGNTLTYRSSGGNVIMVFVRALSGRTRTVMCGPLWKVNDLKETICKMDNVPIKYYTLVNEGKVLNDEETLSSYGISNCSTVHAAPRLRGG
ncbi:MAG: ubiquitin-related domain-containing protein, partial [Benniella sp.]